MNRTLMAFAAPRTFVITGAASGIGRAMTETLLRCHARVFAIDRSDDALAKLHADALKEGGDLEVYTADVCHRETMETVIAKISAGGRPIHVWINAAGIQDIGSFSAQNAEEFDQVMNVNFHSAIWVARRIIPIMEEQGEGVILNVASIAGHVPAPFMTAYVASKHALIGFSRSLKAEMAFLQSPVRVAFASPGFVNTNIIERGKKHGFPEWLSWLLSDAKSCAHEILRDLAGGVDEIYPTLSGKAMMAAYRLLPKTTIHSSRVLLTRSWKDLIFSRYDMPR